jgi:hypothetical protein
VACRFYGGGPIEKDILTRAYLRLIKHVNSIFKVRSTVLQELITIGH